MNQKNGNDYEKEDFEDFSKTFENLNKFNFKYFSHFLFTLNPYEYTILAVLIGLIIAPGLTRKEQDSFGNWLTLIGQQLVVISSQTKVLLPDEVDEIEFEQFKQKIQQQINEIVKKIKKP